MSIELTCVNSWQRGVLYIYIYIYVYIFWDFYRFVGLLERFATTRKKRPSQCERSRAYVCEWLAERCAAVINSVDTYSLCLSAQPRVCGYDAYTHTHNHTHAHTHTSWRVCTRTHTHNHTHTHTHQLMLSPGTALRMRV